jgi:predicted permease
MKEDRDAELAREIRSHLELDAEERMADGVPAEEAGWAARRAFGNVTRVREEARALWTWHWAEQAALDLRSAVRPLARARGFTLLVSGLLAVGIGACTLVFCFVDAVFLRPLPVPHAEELVSIVQRLPRVGAISSFPEAYYQALRDRANVLAFTFGQAGQYDHFAMTDPLPAEDISVRGVTPGFFEALGANTLYGRAIAANDDTRRSDTPAAIVSSRLWRRRLGGDPAAVKGRTVAVNGHAFVVVGVMPEGFNGVTTDTGPDLWISLNAFRTIAPSSPDDRLTLELSGRLKPGGSRAQAETECRSIWQSTMKGYYRDVEHRSEEDASWLARRGVEVESLERGVSVLRDSFGDALKILMASTVFLVLIVCLNVGGILVARAAARQKEFAVQLALGASPVMLVRQVLAEGFVLAALGGTGGFLLALAAMPFARHMLPPIRDRSGSLLPLTLLVGVDERVVVFVLGVSLLAMLVFTASPAITARRSSLDSLLRTARATASGAWRQWLIMAQVALCTLLLLLAGLFVRTLQQLRHVDAGFDVHHIATFTGGLRTRTAADSAAFLRTLAERVRDIPGVVAASVSSVGVMRGRGVSWTIAPVGERITSAHFLNASGNTVSVDYFESMGIRIVRGSGFRATDRPVVGQAGPTPTLVNRLFVAKFFPNAEPIGKRFGFGINGVAIARYEIVGVVNDAKYRSLREPVQPMFYELGVPSESFVLNVRTSVKPDAILEPVQKTLAAIDPELPFREVHVMNEEVEDSVASERLTAVLASTVGACAVLFAGAGIYGSLEYIAAQRRRELAIRMALGARPIHATTVIAKQTVVMVGIGVVLGLGGSSAVASAIRSMLFDISPHDATSIAGVIAFVAVVAVAATAGPVIRAIREDPAETLRHEHWG